MKGPLWRFAGRPVIAAVLLLVGLGTVLFWFVVLAPWWNALTA